jgi:hypothetical protein
MGYEAAVFGLRRRRIALVQCDGVLIRIQQRERYTVYGGWCEFWLRVARLSGRGNERG